MSFKPIYILWILGILVASYFLIKAIIVIIKGTIRIIKNYRKLGKKEFFKRLKEGAERITPIQKTKAEIRGNIISLAGILTGLIATPIIRISGVWFWVEVVLLGALILQVVAILGKWQLYNLYKKQDKIMEELSK